MTCAANNPSIFDAREPCAMASFPPEHAVFGDTEDRVPVAGAFADSATERAAIDTGVAALNMPWKSVIRVTGDDRIPFLNRMLTQELTGTEPGSVAASFWLNRKGRIEADLQVVQFDDAAMLIVDHAVLESTLRTLGDFIIADDVELTPHPSPSGAIRLIGAEALSVAVEATGSKTPPASPGFASGFSVNSSEQGLLVASALGPHTVADIYASQAEIRNIGSCLSTMAQVTPIGVTAFHDARIRSHGPMFLIDFGRTSLPHETGVLNDRVSFTKGCYLGQEVVARMHSLGQPKQKCAVLEAPIDTSLEPGIPLIQANDADAPRVGTITSAESNPAGRARLAIAQLKTGMAIVGGACFTASGAPMNVVAVPGVE